MQSRRTYSRNFEWRGAARQTGALNRRRAPLGGAKLAQLALKHRLPGIYWVRDYVEAGGLMSYGANFGDVGRRAAYSSIGSSST